MGIFSTVRAALSPTSVSQAFKMPRIGRRGPPLAHPMPQLSAAINLVDYNAFGADPQEWFAIMVDADHGNTAPMMDMFSDARDRDAWLDSEARKRTHSMTGKPVVFRPQDGLENDQEAVQAAENCRRILLNESFQFRSMLTHLMSGAVYGYSVSPIDWTTNANREHVPHLQWQHPNRFGFDRDSLKIGFYKSKWRGDWRVCDLDEYPDCFVSHIPLGGRSDYPWRRGPMRSCIIPSFIKRRGLGFWLVLTERFGMPQLYATVPAGMDHDGQSSDDTIAIVQQSLASLSKKWAATFGEGIKIEQIPGSGSISSDTHKALIDWADMTISVGLLGQNLTTKVEGGSFAATAAHLDVAANIHLADAIELGETITQQLLEPLVRYNWPGAPVPVCEISTGIKQPIATEMVVAGVFSDDEMRRSLGYDAKPNGLGATYRSPAPIIQPKPNGSLAPLNGASKPALPA